MFERMGGFTELLLPNNILKEEGILGRMLSDIDEADWTDQIEIIGWLYQYYNTDLFNAIFDGDKSRKSLKAEDNSLHLTGQFVIWSKTALVNSGLRGIPMTN